MQAKENPPVTNYCLEYSTNNFKELGEWSSQLSSFALEYFLIYSWDSCIQKFPGDITKDNLKAKFDFTIKMAFKSLLLV
ncbi:hypothetical protein [Candidatus Uabimicrobium sp. HlEnr_7]|uniref:hypothetical protein n=1 Tax=Candidatus Uabimicrobium helgolandensis TaxID=3095367 RepID=UPI00355802D9